MSGVIGAIGAIGAILAGARSAWGAEESPPAKDAAPGRRGRPGSFRIGVDGSYAIGLAPLASSGGAGVEAAGAGAGLRLALRIAEGLSLGWAGDFHQFGSAEALGTGSDLCGATTGLEATFHALPRESVEPWLRAGAGYRFVWIEPGGAAPSQLVHGPQIARLAGGLDLRVARALSMGPVVGGDLTWVLPGRADAGALAPGAELVAFVFAGLQGQVDLAP